MRLSSFAVIALLVVAVPAAADTGWEHWKISAKQSKIEPYLGRESLLLDDGNAWLDDANFQDGIIEFDMAASAQTGFHGLAFRAADHDNYEEVYLRSHLSDKPDATQYTPVFNGLWGWQIYSGPRFTQQTRSASISTSALSIAATTPSRRATVHSSAPSACSTS